MSQLILVAVPGSTSGGAPVVRVVVVPKLDAAETVQHAGLGDWPKTLSAATFRLVVAPGFQTDDVTPSHDADSDIWQAFFGALRVDAAPAPHIAEPPTVTPTSLDAAQIDATYRSAAAADVDGQSGVQASLGVAAARELRSRWSAASAAGAATMPAAAPPADTAMEFHRVLTMLREHPAVLRRLGLVFDLALPVDVSLATSGTVRVTWPDPPATVPQPLSPRSGYEFRAERGFVPARSATARAGVIDLGDTDAWTTATFDLDNAVARLRDAADGLGVQPTAGAAEDVDGAIRLPALRSAGIALLRKGRDQDFTSRRTAAAANAALPSIADADPLNADDLTLGLRIDVREKGVQRWTSLMRRTAKYTVDSKEILPPGEEEGHVKAMAATRHADGSLRADEVVARWSGWSLTVPREPVAKRAGGRQAALPFEFLSEFDVPAGALLPLRFGRDYHLRARLVDLAGGGVGADDRDVNSGTPPIPYARAEPISSPTVLLGTHLDPNNLGPGGGVGTVVIRSDAADYPSNDERILRAPTATLDVAEQHGMLDGRDERTFTHVQRALAGGLTDPASAGLTVFVIPERGGVTARTNLVGWTGDWPDASDKLIVLEPRNAGGGNSAVDTGGEDDVIHVRLAPAEQATLALSSFLREDFLDHFALLQWRTTSAPVQVIKDGRHPMATPARRLSFVHAVRRQPTDPGGVFSCEQTEGALFSVLHPEPALLGLTPAYSQQLQITAAWAEPDDDEVRTVQNVAVRNVPVERGDEVLRGAIVHQFGDTKHRTVTYSLAAISRFRTFFDPEEDLERFTARVSIAPLSIKSTARPAPPAVRAVVPSFRWTSTEGLALGRHRSGGTIRIELLRPWFLTGDGEHLAVVVERCEIARDPIWTTAVPVRIPVPRDFGPVTGQQCSLADGSTVTAVAFPVVFAEDRWVADIDLADIANSSYRPFVRLALARFQPDSLPGLELSDIVLTDLVQLLPERNVTVTPTGAGALVKLDGLGPEGPTPNRVDVIVEQLAGAGGADLTALTPTTEVPVWTSVSVSSGLLGESILAHGATASTRIRIREVEVLGTPSASAAGSVDEIAERVVFAEVVHVPSAPDGKL